MQEINAPPTLREAILKLNLIGAEIAAKNMTIRASCRGHPQTTMHDVGAVPKRCAVASGGMLRRAATRRRSVLRSGKPYNGRISATRNRSRPCSLGRTWICLRAALKSKLAPTKDECVSLGRNAKRTSEAIGRLMRSGMAHLGFTPHTVLSKTSAFCMHDVELSHCYAFMPMLSGLFNGHAGSNDPSVCNFLLQPG